jgi:hypothetical protein
MNGQHTLELFVVMMGQDICGPNRDATVRKLQAMDCRFKKIEVVVSEHSHNPKPENICALLNAALRTKEDMIILCRPSAAFKVMQHLGYFKRSLTTTRRLVVATTSRSCTRPISDSMYTLGVAAGVLPALVPGLYLMQNGCVDAA